MEKMDKAIVERAIELRKEHCGEKAALTDEEKALLNVADWQDEPLFNLIVDGMSDEERAAPGIGEFIRELEPLKNLMGNQGFTHKALVDVAGYSYPTVFPKEAGWTKMSGDVFSSVLCAIALLYVARDEDIEDAFSPAPEEYQAQVSRYQESPVRSDGTHTMDEPQPSPFVRCLRQAVRDLQNARLIALPPDFPSIMKHPPLPPVDEAAIAEFMQVAWQQSLHRFSFGPEVPATEEEQATFDRVELEGLILELPDEDIGALSHLVESMVLARHLGRKAAPDDHWRVVRPEAKPEEYRDIASGKEWEEEEQTPMRRFYQAADSFTKAKQPNRRTMLLANMRECLNERLEELPHAPEMRFGLP